MNVELKASTDEFRAMLQFRASGIVRDDLNPIRNA
jgi:hypothetical protein